MKCETHPKYKAEKAPANTRAQCNTCETMWAVRQFTVAIRHLRFGQYRNAGTVVEELEKGLLYMAPEPKEKK